MPATLSYPGVYIQEIPSGVRTITGVSTSTAAFVGWAPKGPIDVAYRVQSFEEFQRVFGGLVNGVDLGFAVLHFFLNGGSDAYIVRLVDPAATSA
jgi:phage tail sheath protein FI